MAETKIGGVHVSASIGTAEYSADAKKLKAETVALERSLKGSFSGMSAAVKGFGGALTAGLSIGLLGGLAKKALDFAAAIGTTAKQLGVGTKELQLFRHAAGQMGVKQAEADKGLERLGVTLGKAAAGSKTATAALGAVGVTIEDIKNKSRTEIFGQIADQMNKQGGAAKNAAAANTIFGESASKLTPLLDKGSKGISELSAAAERLGIVLSDRQIQQADQTAQKLEDVRAVLSAQIAGVVADNAASIVSLANALASLTSSIVNFLGSNPQAALGILGALAGSRFGLPGAAAGGIAGIFAGGKVAAGARDASMDPRVRAAAIRKAQAEYARTKTLYGGGPAGKTDRARAAKELQRQIDLGRQAEAALRAGTGSAGGAAIPQFLAPAAKGGGGRKRTPRAPKDTSLRDAFQFDQELMRADMDILRAKQSLATDFVERTALSIQMLDLEKKAFEAELQYRVASGDIKEAQAQQLRLQYDKKDALEREAVLAEDRAQAAEASARLDQVTLELDRNKLESEARLAETAKEQRDVQLRLLDLAYKQERVRLEAILADKQATYAAKEEARRRLSALSETQGNDTKAVIQGTRGPWEEFAHAATDAKKMEEAFQSVAVNGVGAITDGLLDAIEGAKSLGDVFREVAQSIIRELLRIMIQKMIVQAIGSSIGIPGVPGMAGGGTVPVPGYAQGGAMILGGRGGRDRNLLSMNGLPIARVSRGETLSIQPANANGMGMTVPVNVTVLGNMTRETPDQIASAIRRRVATATRKGY
jgi:hypothetical protein